MITLADSQFLQELLGWLAAVSIFTFILSLVLIPWVIGRLPQDCFVRLSRGPLVILPSAAHIIWLILRNCLGLLLLVAGIFMLFLPGQGLLTILLSIFLISFPGKKRLVRRLIALPKVQHGLDWFRKKQGTSPFLWP